MKTSSLIDPYMVWRLFTDLLLSRLNYLLYLLLQPLFCLPSEFTFSSLHCSLIMWPELDLTGSWVRHMRSKMAFRDFLPHPLLFNIVLTLRQPKKQNKNDIPVLLFKYLPPSDSALFILCLSSLWETPNIHFTKEQSYLFLVCDHVTQVLFLHVAWQYFLLVVFFFTKVILSCSYFLLAANGKVFQSLGGSCKCAPLPFHLGCPGLMWLMLLNRRCEQSRGTRRSRNGKGREQFDQSGFCLYWGCPTEK